MLSKYTLFPWVFSSKCACAEDAVSFILDIRKCRSRVHVHRMTWPTHGCPARDLVQCRHTGKPGDFEVRWRGWTKPNSRPNASRRVFHAACRRTTTSPWPLGRPRDVPETPREFDRIHLMRHTLRLSGSRTVLYCAVPPGRAAERSAPASTRPKIGPVTSRGAQDWVDPALADAPDWLAAKPVGQDCHPYHPSWRT